MLGGINPMMMGAGPVSLYNAVAFTGSNGYMTKSGGLSLSDGSRGIFSAWIRIDGGNGTNRYLISDVAGDGFFVISINSSNKLRFDLISSGGVSISNFFSANALTSSSAWRHILASWDVGFTDGNKLTHLYVDGVSDKTTITDGVGSYLINYTSTTHGVGAQTDGSARFVGAFSEFYFAAGQYLDFSNSTNRLKFRDNNLPANIGSDGSTPTGTPPTVYLRSAAASYGTNSGNGGNFTITGTLADTVGPI